MSDQRVIKPWTTERICKPSLDVSQLSLRAVETTESVYTRMLVHFRDASLPEVVRYPSEQRVAAGRPPTAVFRRRDIDEPGGRGGLEPPELAPPTPTPPPEPEPPPPQPPPGTAEIVSWDLFAMLKYRQDWTPSGHGLGELLYSLSLLPNEEVTLELKTWETSRVQQDTEDTLESRNVSDVKTTDSAANEVRTKQESSTKEYIDAKAGYSGFGFSASVAAGWSQTVNDTQETFAKATREHSEQATNEYRSTRKVRIALSREEGSESKSTRRIRNINQAHTLNANYYEILREYAVALHLYDLSLVLLGAEPQLDEPLPYLSWTDPPYYLTLGELVKRVGSPAWVEAFVAEHGVSPVKLLRERWSAPLYEAAAVAFDWSGPGVVITPQQREAFQTRMLEYVRVSPGWIEADQEGALRWGYELIPGKEAEGLDFLYRLLPFSVQQLAARAESAGLGVRDAYRAIAARYARAVVPRALSAALRETRMSSVLLEAAELRVGKGDVILAPGLFRDVQMGQPFEAAVEQRVRHAIGQLDDLRASLEETPFKQEWKATLPTQGVYADVTLGVCSGAEDFFEIQRQLELERSQLQVEKARLELERLKLENAAFQQDGGARRVVVDGVTDPTAVNLSLDLGNGSTSLDLKPPDE